MRELGLPEVDQQSVSLAIARKAGCIVWKRNRPLALKRLRQAIAAAEAEMGKPVAYREAVYGDANYAVVYWPERAK